MPFFTSSFLYPPCSTSSSLDQLLRFYISPFYTGTSLYTSHFLLITPPPPPLLQWLYHSIHMMHMYVYCVQQTVLSNTVLVLHHHCHHCHQCYCFTQSLFLYTPLLYCNLTSDEADGFCNYCSALLERLQHQKQHEESSLSLRTYKTSEHREMNLGKHFCK